MASFVLTAKNNIPLQGLPPIKAGTQINVNIQADVTASTLFTKHDCKNNLAYILNRELGTGSFFSAGNVLHFSGNFRITKI